MSPLLETSAVVRGPAAAAAVTDSTRGRQASSRSTLRGLDWLNFFLADVQTGVGPFLAIYLATSGWNEQRVGIALTVGGIAGILAQTPAGALVAPAWWDGSASIAGKAAIKHSTPQGTSSPPSPWG